LAHDARAGLPEEGKGEYSRTVRSEKAFGSVKRTGAFSVHGFEWNRGNMGYRAIDEKASMRMKHSSDVF